MDEPPRPPRPMPPPKFRPGPSLRGVLEILSIFGYLIAIGAIVGFAVCWSLHGHG